MVCTGYISFDFELQVYFSKKNSSVIPQVYLIVILLNWNIYCVMDFLEILQKVLMYFTLAHHIKHYFWTQDYLCFAFGTNREYMLVQQQWNIQFLLQSDCKSGLRSLPRRLGYQK